MITELAISGGGVKGIAFLGALMELAVMDMLDLKRIATASIGTFISIALCIGFTAKELLDILWDWPLETLKDLDLDDFVARRSIMEGQALRSFFVDILSKKVSTIKDKTLGDIYDMSGIELIISVCCVETGGVEYITSHGTPHINVITLLMMTTALPAIFPPIRWEGRLYIDGGVIDNCPIEKLSEHAWSIVSTSTETPKPLEDTFFGYFIGVVRMIYDNTKPKIKTDRTIEIDTNDIGVTSFDLTVDQRMALITSGREAVRRHFAANAS